MKKPNTLSIQINQPCHEDWNKMYPTKNGRHCESCSKIVVDFSCMTDSEIIQQLSQASNACGRFNQDQLMRPLISNSEQSSRKQWRYLAVASLGLLLSFEPALGMINQQNPRFTPSIAQQSYRFVYPEYTEFSGVVIDSESGTPLSNATITIFAIGETINVNADGTFYLKLRTEDYRTNEHVLIQAPAFESLEFNLSSLFQNPEIKLTKSNLNEVKDPSELKTTFLKVELESSSVAMGMVVVGFYSPYSGGIRHSQSSASEPDLLGQAWEAIEDLFSRKKAR